MDCSQEFGFFSPHNELLGPAKVLKLVEMQGSPGAGIRIAKPIAKRFFTTVSFGIFTCRKEQGIGQKVKLPGGTLSASRKDSKQ
jgi:hypothetical protein